MTVRVRFAPAPTGSLHIGGARTALFNYLFARNKGGNFILRIEDTDRERSTKEFEDMILNGMDWLGMNYDEGPFYQSQRDAVYKKQIEKLLDEGKAYRCYCTSDELDKIREAAVKAGKKPKYDNRCRERKDHPDKPHTIRIKAPLEGTTSYHDICRGTITTDNNELDDFIIARSDGSPTYNLTVVVDDVDMGMTHIIRGDDHINNTPKQIILYNALGYPLPEFAHLPMIHGPDKKKLSKRHGAVSVLEYREQGFLPEAMLNYLARLGWAYGDKEIFTKDELIRYFDLSQVSGSASIFDIEKLKWVNSQHMLSHDNEELLDLTLPYLKQHGLNIDNREFAVKAIGSMRERAKTLDELAGNSSFYFSDEVIFDENAAKKWLDDKGKKALKKIRSEIEKSSSLTVEDLEEAFGHILEATGQKMLELAQPCRVALTGSTASPSIYEVMAVLGKEKVLERINRAINKSSSS